LQHRMTEVNIDPSRLQAENPLFTHRDVGNPERPAVCRAPVVHACHPPSRTAPDGQLKLPQLWSPKIPHRVKQDEVEFYSSFVFCARASAASLSR
jgi:hypothetical protein